jgi:hypothetical protein
MACQMQVNARYWSTRLTGRHFRSYSVGALSLLIDEPGDWRPPRKWAMRHWRTTYTSISFSHTIRHIHTGVAHIAEAHLSHDEDTRGHTSPTRKLYAPTSQHINLRRQMIARIPAASLSYTQPPKNRDPKLYRSSTLQTSATGACRAD